MAEYVAVDDQSSTCLTSRRSLVRGLIGGFIAGGVSAGAVGAIAGGIPRKETGHGSGPGEQIREIRYDGPTQAGVDRPWTPQDFSVILALDWELGRTGGWETTAAHLAVLGRRISELTVVGSDDSNDLLPDGSQDLTVTVGVGPAVVRQFDAEAPGAEELPAFVGDAEVSEDESGGDVMLFIASSSPSVLGRVAQDLTRVLPGAVLRWAQRGYRALSDGPRTRNPFGFHDGVAVPHSAEELRENVWFGAEGRQSTVCVVRRFALDTDGFASLTRADREASVGRTLHGVPLSGGKPFEDVNLLAKHPDGEYMVPLRSHARSAHPSFTASVLMLRRSYAFDTVAGGAGLMFISFQRDLRTFVETQRRMDENDDLLMRFAKPAGNATFLVLPGFDEEHPLGAELLHGEVGI